MSIDNMYFVYEKYMILTSSNVEFMSIWWMQSCFDYILMNPMPFTMVLKFTFRDNFMQLLTLGLLYVPFIDTYKLEIWEEWILYNKDEEILI